MKLKQNNLKIYNAELNLSDKLEMMFYIQKQLQKKMNYTFTEFNNEYFNLMFIGCITELCEVIENSKWKPWKNSSINKIGEIQKELIDVWHFLINLTIASGLEPNELYYEFIRKNQENIKRQKNGY